MQFVQAQSALASSWAKFKRALENHLPSLRFANETSDGVSDEATEDTLEPEPFLAPSVPSKTDFKAQGAWAETGVHNPVANIIGRAEVLTDAVQEQYLPVRMQIRLDVAAVLRAYEHTVKFITVLPLDAMEAISFHLPPQSLVALSAASRHFQRMLSHDRLWQRQLQQKYPRWAAADATPKNGQTWKELVAVATKLEALAAPDSCLDLHRRFNCPVAEYRQFWNSGSAHIQPDFCLSRHAHAAHQRFLAYGNDAMLYPASWLRESVSASLDMVYYCWLEERQLARGAKYLLQALETLAPPDPPASRQAASEAGRDNAHLPRTTSWADTFKWCGGQYSQTDLKQALAMLLSAELRSHQLLAQQYSDPYQPATWCILNANSQLLFDNLAQASACQDHWEQHGSRLLTKAVEKLHMSREGQDEGPSSQGCRAPVAPFDMCRLHLLFSGASLMARSASLPQRAELQHMHGNMYSQGWQHERAVLYYQQEFLLNGSGPYSSAQHAT
ncbi:hypothetical protein WJX82_007097 [Trebouxia sp. C0006]